MQKNSLSFPSYLSLLLFLLLAKSFSLAEQINVYLHPKQISWHSTILYILFLVLLLFVACNNWPNREKKVITIRYAHFRIKIYKILQQVNFERLNNKKGNKITEQRYNIAYAYCKHSAKDKVGGRKSTKKEISCSFFHLNSIFYGNLVLFFVAFFTSQVSHLFRLFSTFSRKTRLY